MTGPIGDAVGVAYADVRFRGDKAPKDVARILDDASDSGNHEMSDIGDKWGDTLDKRLKSSTKNTGRDVARGITAGIEREGLDIVGRTFQIDANGNVTRQWVRTAVKGISDAAESGESTNALKRVGETFSSAIGAGFNVSGKSPLIALLIPVIGIIAELIGAAVQAVGALSALLFIIPNLVFAIGAQAGVLLLAFNGIGKAISGAFAAKDAEEFEKALEGLTPAAKEFVRTFVGLKDLFKPLQDLAQESFFTAFGDTLTRVFKDSGPILYTLRSTIGPVADALGRFARTLVEFLSDPVFNRFVQWLVPQIVQWLDKFGPAMIDFLTGLSNIGFAVLPLFVWFGDVVNETFSDFGKWLSDLSTDQDFLNWLEEVKGDLANVWEAFKQIGRFLFIFVKQLDEAGGDKLVSDLAEQFKVLGNYLASPAGQKALEGLIHLIEALAYLFTILVLDILFTLTSLELMLEFFKNTLWPAITGFFSSIGEAWTEFWTGVGGDITEFGTTATTAFTTFRTDAVATITGLVNDVGQYFTDIRNTIVNNFNQAIDNIKGFFSNLPTTISNAIGDLYDVLKGPGGRLVQGLIDGATNMLGPLKGAFSWLMENGVLSFLPHSPAKEGPLSGKGDPMLAGATIVDRIATGMEMEAPNLGAASTNATSQVLLGAGAVQMNFYGPTPTSTQAGTIGAAAGNSLATTLAQRNTRLAIRSLGAVS